MMVTQTLIYNTIVSACWNTAVGVSKWIETFVIVLYFSNATPQFLHPCVFDCFKFIITVFGLLYIVLPHILFSRQTLSHQLLIRTAVECSSHVRRVADSNLRKVKQMLFGWTLDRITICLWPTLMALFKEKLPLGSNNTILQLITSLPSSHSFFISLSPLNYLWVRRRSK